jgi:RNA polymerase sigma-70 factor (ECF subfamily)
MEQTLAELSDESLIKLVLQNQYRDQRPFWELVNRHRETVWRVCYRFLGNSQDAEDLTQEVFFRAYRALPQFQGKSSFKTWVYRIAINTSQNELRRLARRPQLAETAVEDMAEFLPSSDTPESVWLEHEKQLTLQTALGQLRSEDVEVLLLKDIDERPYLEISEILGISVSAAKMRVQRARMALQQTYLRLYGKKSRLFETVSTK